MDRFSESTGALKEKCKETIIELIASMDLTKSSRLPSENTLCELLGVSRVTVRSVLEDLAAEGRIIRLHGSGTYANPAFHKIKSYLYPYESFENIIRGKGDVPRVRNLGCELLESAPTVTERLLLPPRTKLILSKSIGYAGERFCILNNNFFDQTFFTKDDLIRLNTETTVVYQLLYECTGRKAAWDSAEHSVTDQLRSPELMIYLEQPSQMSTLFLLQQAVTYDTFSRPLFYSEVYFNMDYFGKLGMIRKVTPNFSDYARETYRREQ